LFGSTCMAAWASFWSRSNNPRSCTLHPAPCTLHPTPYTQHPTPYTLHPTPYTLHATPLTLHLHGSLGKFLVAPGYGTEAGSYLRLMDSCISQLKAQGPSRTCNESKEEEDLHGSLGEFVVAPGYEAHGQEAVAHQAQHPPHLPVWNWSR